MFDQPGETRVDVDRYRVKAHVARDLDCGYRVQFLSFCRPHEGTREPVELPVPRRQGADVTPAPRGAEP